MTRRRWTTFSLRTLLLACVLVAVCMRCVVLTSLRQKAAREWLDAHRATYSYDSPLQPDQDWYIRRSGPAIPMRAIELLGIDLFASVKVVLLDCDEIYDLEPIAGLHGLEELYINQCIHPSVDFSVLKSLDDLRKIELSKWSCIDREELAELTQLLPNVQIVAEEF